MSAPMSAPSTRPSQRIPAALAAVLALALTLVGPGPQVALAAADPDLRIEAAATYVLDPAAGAVHVRVDVKATNTKPSSSNYYYYFRDLTFGIHEDASAVRVSDSSGTLRSSVTEEDGYRVVELRLRRNLLYRKTTAFSIVYDLVGGAPRSDGDTRAGAAFATFDVFAWGDPGRSSVTVRLPAGFEPETFGDTLTETEGPDGLVLSASPADSDEFWVGLVAIAEDAYASDEIELAGGVRLEIRSWPEDPEWATSVSDTMRDGLPELRSRIGLDWPVDDVLTVTEVYSILLSGYAGVYFTRDDRIEISEDLDEWTALHEASHAWFNDDLFVERWISEGLAEAYSALVWKELGGSPSLPTRPSASDAGRTDLLRWEHPGRIEDDEDQAYEDYGYNASYWVVRALLSEVGQDGLRDVFAAADANEISYLGAGEPETVPSPDGWRRFLDLLEERAGSEQAEELFREYVLPDALEGELDQRATARERYAELVADGAGWLPPILVRRHMDRWTWDRAGQAMDSAVEVLALRDEVTSTAGALGLAPGDDFETAYESADETFDEAIEVGEGLADALEVLAATRATLDAEPDLLTSIGLWDETPEVDWDEATAAFEADDPDGAVEAAERAAAMVDGAAEVGRQRVIVGVGVGVGSVGLLLSLVVAVRRRRRTRALAVAALAVAPDTDGDGLIVVGPEAIAAEAGAAVEDTAAVAAIAGQTFTSAPDAPSATLPATSAGASSDASPGAVEGGPDTGGEQAAAAPPEDEATG